MCKKFVLSETLTSKKIRMKEKIRTDVKTICETAETSAEALAKLHTLYPGRRIQICGTSATGATTFCVPIGNREKTTVCHRFKQ